MNNRVCLAVLCTAVVVVAGGCGSSGGSSTIAPAATSTTPFLQPSTNTTPSSTTSPDVTARAGAPKLPSPVAPAKLVAEAESICTRRNGELAALPKPAGAGATQTAQLASQRGVIEQRAADELGRISPPASLAWDWRKLVNMSRYMARRASNSSKIAGVGPAQSTHLRIALDGLAIKILLRTATHIGVKSCAHVG